MSLDEKNSEVKEIGYDFGTHIVYIEVDENMHKYNYCQLGEIKRMINIYFDDGEIERPTVFIRYNPDSFVDSNNIEQKLSQLKREKLLIEWIRYFKSNAPKEKLSIKFLFYDGHNNGRGMHYYIDPYKIPKIRSCEKCSKEFYIKEMYRNRINRCIV